MLISPAYAQATGSPFGSDIMAFLPMIAIVVVFYFLLIRPQQKKAKDHAALLKTVRPGDKVVTTGGIVGVIVTVKEKTISIRSCAKPWRFCQPTVHTTSVWSNKSMLPRVSIRCGMPC